VRSNQLTNDIRKTGNIDFWKSGFRVKKLKSWGTYNYGVHQLIFL